MTPASNPEYVPGHEGGVPRRGAPPRLGGPGRRRAGRGPGPSAVPINEKEAK